MSKLTRCNYCTYKRIKAMAKQKSWRITRKPADFGLGGIDILVHPKDVKISLENREQYFVAWFMELTSYCVC